MNSFNNLLEEALEAWEDTRLGTIDELRNIPAKHWDFRPDPGARSVREITVHILEVAMMMTGELIRYDTNFRRVSWPKLLKLYAGPAYRVKNRGELIKLMRSQLRGACRQFQTAGEIHMLQTIERFDGREGTRFAWLQHGIAQEMYHRGQLTTYQRIMGLEPALTQRIRNG